VIGKPITDLRGVIKGVPRDRRGIGDSAAVKAYPD
jgi:hypothetical protein